MKNQTYDYAEFLSGSWQSWVLPSAERAQFYTNEHDVDVRLLVYTDRP